MQTFQVLDLYFFLFIHSFINFHPIFFDSKENGVPKETARLDKFTLNLLTNRCINKDRQNWSVSNSKNFY